MGIQPMGPHAFRVNPTGVYAVKISAPAASHSGLFLLFWILVANVSITTLIKV